MIGPCSTSCCAAPRTRSASATTSSRSSRLVAGRHSTTPPETLTTSNRSTPGGPRNREQNSGTPLHYLSGDLHYINSVDSRWSENSRATVRTADICVFVIVERFGAITWETELREALEAGVPFLFLCLADTYRKYIDLIRSVDS